MTDGTCDAPGCDLDSTEELMSGPNAGQEYCAYHASALTPHFLTADEARQHGVPQDTKAWKENATGAIRIDLPGRPSDGPFMACNSGPTLSGHPLGSEEDMAYHRGTGAQVKKERKFDPESVSYPTHAALETLELEFGALTEAQRAALWRYTHVLGCSLYGRGWDDDYTFDLNTHFGYRKATRAQNLLVENLTRAHDFAVAKAAEAQEAREAEELEQQAEAEKAQRVSFVYTNHRGVTETRTALPLKIHFGTTQHHREPQWFLRAFDIDKKLLRDFALNDCDFQGDFL